MTSHVTTAMPPAPSAVRPDYLRIQQRICAELGVNMDAVDHTTSEAAAVALRAFTHLAYLWSDPYSAPEGRYDDGVHTLVWACALDVYILDGQPPQGVPIRMSAIAAQASHFRR